MGKLDAKVAIVTGAGRGIGRSEALSLAAEGAAVVVNDLGGRRRGGGGDARPAQAVVEAITAIGGRAVASFADVTDPEDVDALLTQALDEFGRVDVLVNNAGILCDAMIFSSEPDEWFSVVNTHLMGHYLPTRAVAKYWRERGKAGDASHRAIINTTSESGLFGNASQSNYAAAKMGIVAFTIAVSRELGKYGVTCNAIAPRARTRLTVSTFDAGGRDAGLPTADNVFDPMAPENIAPFVTFLATEDAADITGQTFVVYGGSVGHVKLPHVGDVLSKPGGRLTVEEIAARRDELFKNNGPNHYESPRGYARMPPH
jgi:NAD(P)-dependent dehydrogenase (short-subunit alcohol dehydrogenase family)